jgi:D-alanyl-D-alanine carboxypeptidase
MPVSKTFQKLTQAAKIIDVCLKYKQYREEIPALAFGLTYQGKVVLAKGYGFADVAKKIPVTPETCFRIASISKIFTTVAIMQLVEGGKIKLDDTVNSHLPWFKSTNDPRVEKITIRQLLTHTSGLTRDGDTLHWVDGNFPDLNHLKQYIHTMKLSYAPNTRWKYSNVGDSIIGALIEQVSGETFEAYIQKHICQKLGMTLTSSKFIKDIQSRMTIGRGRKIPGKDREIFPNIDAKAMVAATGLSSNVIDLLKFVRSFFRGNTSLITKASKGQMFKIQWTNKRIIYLKP